MYKESVNINLSYCLFIISISLSISNNKIDSYVSIFIIKGFRTIVFISIVISTRFPNPNPTGNLHKTPNYVLYWIHGGRLFWFRYP